KRLVAHLVAEEGSDPTPASLRDHLAAELPDYLAGAARRLAGAARRRAGAAQRPCRCRPPFSVRRLQGAP
ncbi:hypothetical protein, partial [Streptomyces tendae]